MMLFNDNNSGLRILATSNQDSEDELPVQTTQLPEPDYRKGVFVLCGILAFIFFTATGIVSLTSAASENRSPVAGGIQLGIAALCALSSVACYCQKPADPNDNQANKDSANGYILESASTGKSYYGT